MDQQKTQQTKAPSRIYQGKKLKNNYNKDVDINEFVTQQEITPIANFFQSQNSIYGVPTCLLVVNQTIIIGTQSSAILIFDQGDDFSQPRQVGYNYQKTIPNRGQSLQLTISPDQTYFACLFETNYISIVHLGTAREIHAFRVQNTINQIDNNKYARKLSKISFVPITLNNSNTDSYYELIILDDYSNLSKYTLEINYSKCTIRIETTQLYKYGRVCEFQKFKPKKVAKIYDNEFQLDPTMRILEFQLMNEKFIPEIQYQKEDSSTRDDYSQSSIERNQDVEQHGFSIKYKLQNLFKKRQIPSDQRIQQIFQFTLVAVLFSNRIEVIKLNSGKVGHQEPERIIKRILQFERPDAFAYEIVYGAKEEQSDQGTCCWGIGSYKETNKRYAQLIVNWGGREFYSFKCMKSDFDLSIVQGGHFFMAQAGNTIKTEFITNSVFISFTKQLQFLSTLQFEYGVPFDQKQLEKFAQQESKIKLMSSGHFEPKFSVYKNTRGGGDVLITSGIMESIKDGYQNPYIVDLELPNCLITQASQFDFLNDKCYILNGPQVIIVKLKKWDEYLEELGEQDDSNKLFQTAINILTGKLTLLSGIPENDVMRYECTKSAFCKIALNQTLMCLDGTQTIQKVKQTLAQVQNFLLQTQNEDYLFSSIEELFTNRKQLFYSVLCETLQDLDKNHKQFSLPSSAVLRTFQELKQTDRLDIVELIIMRMVQIDFDTKPVIDFLMENDLIDCMIRICSLVEDFLTPYLRIITILQVKLNQKENEDDNITQLSTKQLGSFALKYIEFCFTGTHKLLQQKQAITFTDKQFKTVMQEIFEYLFDMNNLSIFLSIGFQESLQILLEAFQPRIQETLKQLENDQRLINIRLDRFTESGILTEILLPCNNYVENTLGRVYVLIKQAELTYFTSIQSYVSSMDLHYDISAAFTVHTFTQGVCHMQIDHIMLALNRYVPYLRKNEPIFDIQWVLKGRVQKDVEQDVIKCEFLWRVANSFNKILQDYNEKQITYTINRLYYLAQDSKWLFVQSWCKLKTGKIREAISILVEQKNLNLREKVFEILSQQFLHHLEEVTSIIIDYIVQLLECSQQRLYSLLYLNFRQNLQIIVQKLIQVPIHYFMFDVEGNQLTKHVSLSFLDYVFLRTPFQQCSHLVQIMHFKALCIYTPKDVIYQYSKQKYPAECMSISKEYGIILDEIII